MLDWAFWNSSNNQSNAIQKLLKFYQYFPIIVRSQQPSDIIGNKSKHFEKLKKDKSSL